MQETWVWSLVMKEMATLSSILPWEIPWTKELGRLQSMGSQRVGLLATKQQHKLFTSVTKEPDWTWTHNHNWSAVRYTSIGPHTWLEQGLLRLSLYSIYVYGAKGSKLDIAQPLLACAWYGILIREPTFWGVHTGSTTCVGVKNTISLWMCVCDCSLFFWTPVGVLGISLIYFLTSKQMWI